MASHEPTINSALSFGWKEVNAKPGFFIGLTLLVILLAGAVSALGDLVAPQGSGASLPVQILVNLVNMAIQFGLITVVLKVVSKKEATYNDLGAATVETNKFGQYVLTNIIYGAIVGLGLIALILPGIYFALKYWAAPYLVIDKGANYSQAFHESGELTSGRMLSLLGFLIVMGLVNILGFLLLGVGLLFTVPVTTIATAFYYRQLAGAPAPEPSAE